MKTIRKNLLFFLFAFSMCLGQVVPGPSTQSTSVSGSTLTFGNALSSPGGLTATFEEKISGSPVTVSIVIAGCMRGGTCDTLDTYTTVANANRAPSITKIYDYFTVTPTWTGGSSPIVTVNYSTAQAPVAGSGVSGSINVNSGAVTNPNFGGTPAAPVGLNNVVMQVSGSNVSGLELGVPTDLSYAYVGGDDPCADALAAMNATKIAAGNSFTMLGFYQFFPDGIVPCNSNLFENLVVSGTLDLGPFHFVKSVPWVSPGVNQRFVIKGTGTADVGTATAVLNTTIQDCTSEAPGWNGVASQCQIHGINVPAYGASGHNVVFTGPHGPVQAGTYYPSIWLGGMGAAGTQNGGSFGQVIRDLTIWPGAGGGDFALYVTGAQEQSKCENVTLRATNAVGIFLDRVQGTSTGPSHFQINSCAPRMDDANTAAQGYPIVGSTAMGYGIVVEMQGDLIYGSGGGCTQEPQAYPTTISSGAISAATLTYGGVGCSTTPSCNLVSNRGTPGTWSCTFTGLSGGAVSGITVTPGTASGYSAGDFQAGGVEIRDATINGDSTKKLWDSIWIDACQNCSVKNVHIGWDADYGIVYGGGNGAMTGGYFENLDFDSNTKGIIHFGKGIDGGQLAVAIGRVAGGAAVGSIVDDVYLPAGTGTTASVARYIPGRELVYGDGTTAPLYQSGISTTQINDFTNQLAVLKLSGVASAVDQITVTSAATANPATVSMAATGTDSNINFLLQSKGTGVLQLGSSNASVSAVGLGTFVGITGTGTIDFSGATLFKIPVGAGATSSADGVMAYDTTNKNTHCRGNGADALCAFEAAALTVNVISKGAGSNLAGLTGSSLTDNGTTVVTAEEMVVGTAGAVGLADKSIGATTAAMTAQSSATCTNVTNMTWTIAASKNYKLHCMIPVAFATSATIQFCMGGPGTPTSHTIHAAGLIGASAAYGESNLLASATYGTKTAASGAPGAVTEIVTVDATIRNGATASGTALTLQTAANGTNTITVQPDAICQLVQEN